MSNGWKRPATVPFPKIWSTFERKINGNVRKFWIQDITEDLDDKVAHYMSTGFTKDEPLSKYINLPVDEEYYATVKTFYKDLMQERLGLICLMDDAEGIPKVVGMNCMGRVAKDDENKREYTIEKTKRIVEMIMYVTYKNNPYETLKINEYLCAMGLYVLPEYRKLGIGLELLKARKEFCKTMGFKVSCTVFTSAVSQRLAEKAGFRDLTVISYSDLQKVKPEFSLPGIEEHSKYIKLMYFEV